ncbi:MAG: hypothetical protein WC974_09120 [Thermoplasmata archaeon]
MRKKENLVKCTKAIANRLYTIDLIVQDMLSKKQILDKRTQKRYIDSAIVDIYEFLEAIKKSN